MSAIMRPIAVLLTAAALWIAAPIVIFTTPAAAQARVEISAEFRSALEPYGEFRQHSRWGEVWVPAHLARDWRPYTVGHWVYSDDYGWYWVSDESEAQWGWVVFHYGRWVFERDSGWVWVAGKEWGPGFVNWRRGREHIGWAPMPTEEIIAEVVEQPDYWNFVRIRDFVTPRIVTVLVPPTEARILIQQTVVENRTVIIRERNFAVNPGIPPAIVAAAVGRTIPTYQVRPVVLAGTAELPGATLVRADELRQRRDVIVRQATTVQQTANVVQPARNVPPPQPLARNENGRLGDNPPRAATGVTGTTGTAPSQAAPPAGQGQQRPPGAAPPTQPPGAAQQPGQPPAATSGQAPSQPNLGTDQRRRGAAPSNQPPAAQRPGQPPAATTGQAPAQPNLEVEQRRRGAAPSDQPPAAQRLGQPPAATTGQAPTQPNLGAEQRGRDAKQRARGAPQTSPVERGQPPATTGAAPPSPPREPNSGTEQRRGSGLPQNRATPPQASHERATPPAAARPQPPVPSAQAPAARAPAPPPQAPVARTPAPPAPAAQAPRAAPSTTGAAPRGGPPEERK